MAVPSFLDRDYRKTGKKSTLCGKKSARLLVECQYFPHLTRQSRLTRSKQALPQSAVLYNIKFIFSIDFNKIKVYTKYCERRDGMEMIPEWLASLEDEDLVFIKKFILASGSLKEMAKQYGVTYPTVRLRLDRLIQKIQIGDQAGADPYVALVKRLAVNDRLDFDTAKLLISEYRKTKKEED